MGRIRTIKPEFPQSQSMGKVSRDARLLFVQLWTLVDDSGRTRAASRMLASLLYPYDDDAPKLIGKWLKELEDVGSITRYSVDGDDYLEVCKWSQHQKIDKPSKSKFPAREDSSNTRRTIDEPSALDQGSGTEGPRTEGPKEQGGASADSSKADRPDDVPADLWTEWTAFRKSKRASVTQRVLDDTRKKAAAAGMTLAEALTHWIAQGYVGFFPPRDGNGGKRPDGGFDRNGRWQGVPRGKQDHSNVITEDDPLGMHPKQLLARENGIRASKSLPPLTMGQWEAENPPGTY